MIEAGLMNYKALSKRQRMDILKDTLKYSKKTVEYAITSTSTHCNDFNEARIDMTKGKIPMDIDALQKLLDAVEHERRSRITGCFMHD